MQVFYELKGLILADARCPESFYLMIVFWLACRKKGLILADARCPTWNRERDGSDFIKVMVYIQVTIQNHLGPSIGIVK